MADKLNSCATDLTFEELIKAAFVKYNGKTYLLVNIATIAPEDIEKVVTCSNQLEVDQLLKECLDINNDNLVFNVAYISDSN